MVISKTGRDAPGAAASTTPNYQMWVKEVNAAGGLMLKGYIAAETRQMGLKPVNTPACSPQSSGIAESFVNTRKRDYVNRIDLADARTVTAQMGVAFERFKQMRPPSALKMKHPGRSGSISRPKSISLRSSRRYMRIDRGLKYGGKITRLSLQRQDLGDGSEPVPGRDAEIRTGPCRRQSGSAHTPETT